MSKYKIAFIGLLTIGLASCNDYLDQEPPSSLTPEGFYSSEDQVQAVSNKFYRDILPRHGTWSYGTYADDNNTDNQFSRSPSTMYSKDLWRVGNTNDNWSWTNVRNVNYQLNQTLSKYEAGKISGDNANIRQAIGEMYFFRGYVYYDLLKKFGDLPILTQALPDDEAVLVAANVRQPRNEVARFIIANLDTALTYMKTDEADRTRLTPDAVKLFKSRVALYEGSWETNFAGTPFVPNGEGWPGKAKNPDYKYPTGSVEAEAKYFLQIAADAAEEVADKYKDNLTVNNGVIPQHLGQSNPYLEIWGTNDGSGVPDIILWRQYNNSTIGNYVEINTEYSQKVCLTRSMVEGFLMKDGRPIYNSQYEYCDTSLSKVRTNRDPRIAVFLEAPGDTLVFKNVDDVSGTQWRQVQTRPEVYGYSDATGYMIRKGQMFDRSQTQWGNHGENIGVIFRATEALLNYMEAEYMLTHNLSSKILEYWRDIRRAAGFTGDAVDPQVTIDATDMSKEASDWGAWTAGKLLTDKVLYNIRRERRCELMAESLRDQDLKRWRSFDQLINTPVHVEGFHFWNTPMEGWYYDVKIVADGSSAANVSSPELSEYFRPHEVIKVGNEYYNGLTWHMAHYLQPLPLRQFLLTAPDHATMEDSPLYQNPYWPMTADQPAEK